MNADIVTGAAPLADGDEVSLLPPVAGGQDDLVEIRPGPLNPEEAVALVTTPASGGIGVFAGIVRETNEGNRVAEIDYTAFEEFALKEIRAVVTEARARWPLHRVAVAHSTGRLKWRRERRRRGFRHAPGRGARRCRAIIDGVKDRAPIWKQEFGPDGTRWVNLPDEANPPPAG